MHGRPLDNGGFETGTASPWTADDKVASNNAREVPHSGTWFAWIDGFGTTHTDKLAQTSIACVSSVMSLKISSGSKPAAGNRAWASASSCSTA